MNWNDPAYVNFKKNEIVRPATVGMYWIVIALCTLLIVMTVISPPVSAAAYLDNTRCIGGTDDPATGYIVAHGLPDTDIFSCLVTTGSDADDLARQWICCDELVTGNVSASNGSWIHNCQSNTIDIETVNGNGTTTFGNDADKLITNEGGYCIPGNYAGIKGYFSMDAYTGDLTSTTYAMWQLLDTPPPAPVCSFTVSPTSGQSPLLTTFTDTSTGSPSAWSWIVSDNATGLPVLLATVQSFQNYLNGAGKHFDVSLNVTAPGGDCSVFVPKLISTTANQSAPGYIVVNLDVKNSVTGNLIYDSQVGIQNTTSGVWRNSTAPTGLVYFDSTGTAFEYPLSLGEIIQEAACATGYSCANITFHIPYNNYKSYLNLVPDSVVNQTGTFTLVTTVVMQKSGLPIKGASVQLDNGMMKLSNSAGAATFYNITAGGTKATASFIGYQTAEKTFTGIAGQTKMITLELVVEGETPVPTQVSPTPTVPGGAGNGTSLAGANAKGVILIDEILTILIDFGVLVVLVLMGWFFVRIGKDVFGL